MDKSIEKSEKDEIIPLIKMAEPNKGKLEYQLPDDFMVG